MTIILLTVIAMSVIAIYSGYQVFKMFDKA